MTVYFTRWGNRTGENTLELKPKKLFNYDEPFIDNADSMDNGDTQGNEDEYMQPGTDDTAEENDETADNRQRVPTADEIKALLSRIEQGTVTAGDVADRFETDENGNEWAVINGQRVSPDAVITGAAVPVDSNGQPAGQPVYFRVSCIMRFVIRYNR